MNLYKYESYKLLSKALVSFFRQLAESNEKSFIISGGSSPKQFLRYLAEEPLDWSKISLILSDERLVSPKDKKSNYRFIKMNLLDRIGKNQEPDFFPTLKFYSSGVKDLIERLNDSYKTLPKPEIAFIGVGQDGHFASIFPNHSKPKHSSGYFLVNNEDEDFYRISLTIEEFLPCKNIFLIIHGNEKKSVLKRILDLEERDDIPILHFLSQFKGEVNVCTDIEIST